MIAKSNKMILPFNIHLTPHINKILKKYDIIPINSIINKFQYLIPLGKDRLDKFDNSNIVYRINCNNCPANYIGTSKRQLKKRRDEHIRDVKKLNVRSALTSHILENDSHSFNFEKMLIIDIETSKAKREFAEILNIYYMDHTVNRMEDIYNLKFNYKQSLDLMKKHKL